MPKNVGDLVERSLPTPEIFGSNPAIGFFLWNLCKPIADCIEKTKIKEKEAGNGPFLKINVAANWRQHQRKIQEEAMEQEIVANTEKELPKDIEIDKAK